jgi:hypothetical protein
MARMAAVISAALALTDNQISSFQSPGKASMEPQTVSKWKMAGRHRQLTRRPKR